MAASYPTRLARLLGPVCVGIAVWCAAGLVSVESAADPSARVVAPASWWVLVAGVALASLVPGWRRAPLTALPALAATLPWWPVPLPAVALLWTGPMAWLPILAALAAAEGSRRLGALARVVRAHEPPRATMLAALLTLLLGVATIWSVSPRLPDGDESHYLVITQSLLRDGDLRIENNHAQRDYLEFLDRSLAPDFVNRGQDGEIYSIHAPGVSALVLPGFALFGYRGAQLTILFCLMITTALVWRVAWRATGDTAAAWFAWAGVTGAATTLLLGVMVFPDSPAALGSAAGVWLLVRLALRADAVRPVHLVAVSSALAILPWLHTRFAVLAAGFGLAIVIALLTEPGRHLRARVARTLAFMAVPVGSAAAWFLQFWLIYGTVDPRAPYRGSESLRDWIWGAVVGLFADQQFGLLVFAPVLVAAFIGGCRASGRSLRFVCAASAAVLISYTILIASYHMWWAGLPALPARFLTATIPLFALPLAIGWTRATSAGRAVLLAMLAVSWAMTALVVFHDDGLFAFNVRDGQAPWLEWLGPVVNLPRAWPSFFWRSQGDFLTHVIAQLGMWAAAWVCLRIFVRRHIERADVGRFAVAVWVLLGLMGGAEVGWRLNGVSGLDPARSQLAVHGAGRTWLVSPWSIDRAADGAPMAIRPEELPLSDHPEATLMLADAVPAGEYRVDVNGAGERTAVITARVGRSQAPLAVWSWSSDQAQEMRLSLPVPITVLVLEADSPEAAAGLDVVLRTVGPAVPVTEPGSAFRFGVDGDTGVYFLDDEAFVEPGGFWVHGGHETRVVWTGGPSQAGRTRTLRLLNGGALNDVTVRVGAWREVFRLNPGEERLVPLPVADATGSWRVSIHSASGFRPSEVTGSGDDRYLGVWVGR